MSFRGGSPPKGAEENPGLSHLPEVVESSWRSTLRVRRSARTGWRTRLSFWTVRKERYE